MATTLVELRRERHCRVDLVLESGLRIVENWVCESERFGEFEKPAPVLCRSELEPAFGVDRCNCMV